MRELIAREMVRNTSQQAIGRQLGISQQAVSRHARALRKQWAESAAADVQEAIGRECATLDEVAREAWSAWQRSVTPLTKKGRAPTGDLKALEVVVKAVNLKLRAMGVATSEGPKVVVNTLDFSALFGPRSEAPHPIDLRLAEVERLAGPAPEPGAQDEQ